jgi:ABC-type bacteriocin/lantibiotic exporter with double-glycine peptidase domain
MLIAMLYRKHAKISEATNKEFDQGEIVNFVQVDAERVFWLCYASGFVSRIPFLFIIAFGAFFYYFKWTFMSGVAVLILAIASQAMLAMWLGKVQTTMMAAKDDRMIVTTEALNNPKMLKLYSWTDNFIKRIQRKR